MRLIDAEYLLDLIKDINGERYGYIDAEDISNAPTVDAVPVSTLEQIKWERDSFVEQIREIGGEPFAKWDAMDVVKVVRCRDCKYYRERHVMNCSYHINAVKENWFCSQGEVKEDGII